MSRRTALLAGLAVLLAGSLALFGAAFYLMRAPATGTTVTIGGPFTLTDENGARVTDKTYAGKPRLVFFGYTHCPDVCPTTLFEVSEVLNSLGPDADKTAALFITVDPERDTPAVLKDYLSSFNPNVHGLSGSQDEILAVARAYRAFAQKVPRANGDYSMDHTAIVYLMDKNGQFVAPFNLKRPPEQAAKDLKAMI